MRLSIVRLVKALIFIVASLFVTACSASERHAAMSIGQSQIHSNQHSHGAVNMVVLGDSLAYGTGASSPKNGYAYRVFSDIKRTHPQSTYANLAVPGATSIDVLRNQVPKLRRENATLILLTVGSNDAFVYRDVVKFTKDYRRLLVAIRAEAPHARIVATGMPDASESSHVPAFARTIVATMCAMQNEVIAKESSAQGARVVDLYALTSQLKKRDRPRFLSHDDLHPSDAGYAEIANAALPVVRAAVDSH